MTARSLEEIQNQLIIALAKANSPATDISPGSVLGALVRSLSVVHLEQDNRLEDVYKKSSFLTAEGFELDDLGRNFGKNRKQGARSEGFVIFSIESGNVELPQGTTLTNLSNGNQYVTTNSNLVTLTSFKEEVLPVLSLETGLDKNLDAGTTLAVTYSTLLNQPISAKVGFKRAIDGTYCGSLSKGLDFESDSEYRNRLINSIYSNSLSTEESIKQKILDIDFITSCWIRTVIPGTIEILISSSIDITQEQKTAILNYIRPFISSGILPIITVNQLTKLDFTVLVTPYPNSNLDELKNQIKSTIQFYLNSVSENKTFSINELNAQLTPLAFFINAQLDTELDSLTATSYQLQGLKVTYVD